MRQVTLEEIKKLGRLAKGYRDNGDTFYLYPLSERKVYFAYITSTRQGQYDTTWKDVEELTAKYNIKWEMAI